MGRASTITLLPLDSYARIMGIDPRHFNSIVTTAWPASASCAALWYQYAWQNQGAVSREDLAEAIQQAEADICKELGYYVVPTWVEEERKRWTFTEPRDFRFQSQLGIQRRGLRKSIRAEWAKIISGGIRAIAPIAVPTDGGITWVYTDEDGDGEEDTLTIGNITWPADVSDPCEVAVYFAGHTADERYRIRPIVVDIAAQTIVISRWLLIDPAIWEGQSEPIVADPDADIDPNLVTSVDIYRLYNDPQEQARFEWEPLPDEDCDQVCGYWYQPACLGLRDHKRGIAVPYPAVYSAGEFAGREFTIDREPDRVRLWYQSGEGMERCEMIQFWQRAIAYYATALLMREICGCEALERHVAHWREPPNLEYELWPERALSNPFGPQRGAMFAWDRVQQNLIGRGMAV